MKQLITKVYETLYEDHNQIVMDTNEDERQHKSLEEGESQQLQATTGGQVSNQGESI